MMNNNTEGKTMTTYIITEKQDANSTREGQYAEAASLKGAKILATRAQVFAGTTLTVQDAYGRVLSTKRHGVWSDRDDV